VWAKAHDDNHAKMLEKIGVDKVIHPERDMARRIAHHITSKKMVDYIELTKEFSIAEIVASRKIDNKSLSDINLRGSFGCSIVAVQRGEDLIVKPVPEETIHEGDLLIIIGRNEDIDRFDQKGV
jgi:trk system potassium uptake protein TrkA